VLLVQLSHRLLKQFLFTRQRKHDEGSGIERAITT
jgi:hypothetical protein